MRTSRFFQLGTLLLAVNSFAAPEGLAATYYIDYETGNDGNNGASKSTPWKRCPGMPGFAGNYLASAAGDTFIFKGGVTWPALALPLTIEYSGREGARNAYTTDRAWHRGRAWAQPTFDGEGRLSDRFVFAQGKSFFVVNDIRMINAGIPYVENTKVALRLIDSDNFAITNCTISPETWIGLRIYAVSVKTFDNIEIAYNDISRTGIGIAVSTDISQAIINNLDVHDNSFHDTASQLFDWANGEWVHGDAFVQWGIDHDASTYVTNLKIYNNLFYGDWSGRGRASNTSLITVSDATQNALIYNNVAYPSAGRFSWWIWFKGHASAGRGGGHHIYNNSFYRHPNVTVFTPLEADAGSPNITVKNNIFGSSGEFVYRFLNTTGHSIDHNGVHGSGYAADWNGTYLAWPDWQALGHDVHGTNQNPEFVSASDLHLTAASPEACKNGGVDLSMIFKADKDGYPRPAGQGWSMGAYQFPSKDTTPPGPPKGVRAIPP